MKALEEVLLSTNLEIKEGKVRLKAYVLPEDIQGHEETILFDFLWTYMWYISEFRRTESMYGSILFVNC